jgi:hypothetical protein
MFVFRLIFEINMEILSINVTSSSNIYFAVKIIVLKRFEFSVWKELTAREAGGDGSVPGLVPGVQYAGSYAGMTML